MASRLRASPPCSLCCTVPSQPAPLAGGSMCEYGNVEPPHPNPLPDGERGKRKPPRWVIPFLRALARTGVAREAAKDAGIDHSTAYERRKAHADFAADWA